MASGQNLDQDYDFLGFHQSQMVIVKREMFQAVQRACLPRKTCTKALFAMRGTVIQFSGKSNGVTLNQNALGTLTQTVCICWVKWLFCVFDFGLYILFYPLGHKSHSHGGITAKSLPVNN